MYVGFSSLYFYLNHANGTGHEHWFVRELFLVKNTYLYTSLGETGFLREFFSGIDIRIMSQPENVFQTPKLISRERGSEPSFLVRIHAQFHFR